MIRQKHMKRLLIQHSKWNKYQYSSSSFYFSSQQQKYHLSTTTFNHNDINHEQADFLNRPRRSVLYMPGSNKRALEKAQNLAADTLIFDLEDARHPQRSNSRPLSLRWRTTRAAWGPAPSPLDLDRNFEPGPSLHAPR